jgi:hypothetical protein
VRHPVQCRAAAVGAAEQYQRGLVDVGRIKAVRQQRHNVAGRDHQVTLNSCPCGWRGCTPNARLSKLTGSSRSDEALQPEDDGTVESLYTPSLLKDQGAMPRAGYTYVDLDSAKTPARRIPRPAFSSHALNRTPAQILSQLRARCLLPPEAARSPMFRGRGVCGQHQTHRGAIAKTELVGALVGMPDEML